MASRAADRFRDIGGQLQPAERIARAVRVHDPKLDETSERL